MTVTFRGGETAGSIAEKQQYLSAKQETSGSVAKRIYEKEPEVKLQTLERDTVCFRGKEDEGKKKHSVLKTIAGLGITAAAIVALLGFSKKYNWIDKIPHDGTRNFIDKYLASPSKSFCHWIKETGKAGLDWVRSKFHSRPALPPPPPKS